MSGTPFNSSFWEHVFAREVSIYLMFYGTYHSSMKKGMLFWDINSYFVYRPTIDFNLVHAENKYMLEASYFVALLPNIILLSI